LRSVITSSWLCRTVGLTLAGILAGCSNAVVFVEGTVPRPLIEPYPISIGVILPTNLKEYKLIDESTGRNEVSVEINLGKAQDRLWKTLLTSIFEEVVFIESYDDLKKSNIDAVFKVDVTAMQYGNPKHTKMEVYEVWFEYQFSWFEKNQIEPSETGVIDLSQAQPFSRWKTTAYGKRPYTGSLLENYGDETEIATMNALRDTGASFILSLPADPGFRSLMSNQETKK
jgi:hypothetical protein